MSNYVSHHRGHHGHQSSGESFTKLKNMIMSYRVTELTMLLQFAGKNKSGKKSELQQRAIEVARLAVQKNSSETMTKIRELHQQRFSDQQTPDSKHLSYQQQQSSSYGKHYDHLNSPQSYTSMPSLASLSGHSSRSPAVPVPADVRFKHLPFYDVIEDLVKPCALLPQQQSPHSRFVENNVNFQLSVKQANDVASSRVIVPGSQSRHNGLTSAAADYDVQIQLRFCLLETTSEQADAFPSNCCVKVNAKMCTLPQPLPTNKPGVEPKRPSRPVNITTLCKISPMVTNHIQISWAPSTESSSWPQQPKAFAVTVHLVRRLTASDLQSRIRARGVKDSDFTRAMVKEKLRQDPDSEIATMSLKGSLLCPLGKMRMAFPCRAQTCSHIQCFDGLLFLQMNEKKPAWTCPVCDGQALFKDLFVDGLFMEILDKAPAKCEQVEFLEDGSWQPLGVNPTKVKSEPKTAVDIDIGEKRPRADSVSSEDSQPAAKKANKEPEVICIDDSDDSDDDETEEDEEATAAMAEEQAQVPPAAHQQSSRSSIGLAELAIDDLDFRNPNLFLPYHAPSLSFPSWAQNCPSPIMDIPHFPALYNQSTGPSSTVSRPPTSQFPTFDVISIDDD